MPEPVPAPSRARRWTSVLVSLAVTVACFGAILAFLDLEWEGTEAMLRRVTAGYLAVLAAFLLVMHVLRAMRFRVLLAEPVSLRRLMSIDMLCQFYANFLPFRTGEVALPVLLRREGVTVPRTVAMLLVARSFDVLALLVLGSVLHMWGYDWIAPLLQRLRWPLAGATAVGGALGVPLLCGSAGGVRWLADRVAAPERGWIPRQAWLADRLQDLSAGLALVNRRRLWWTAGLTLPARSPPARRAAGFDAVGTPRKPRATPAHPGRSAPARRHRLPGAGPGPRAAGAGRRCQAWSPGLRLRAVPPGCGRPGYRPACRR